MTTYSNGWGHLIATIAVLAMCTMLVMFGKIQTDVFAAVVSPVVSFWFMSGAVNRFNGGNNVSNSGTQSGMGTGNGSGGNTTGTFQSRSN